MRERDDERAAAKNQELEWHIFERRQLRNLQMAQSKNKERRKEKKNC